MVPNVADLKLINLKILSTYAFYNLKSACPSLIHEDAPSDNIVEETAINPLTEYPLFSKLPVEMRNEIWKQFSKLEPRIVTVDWTPYPEPNNANNMPTVYHIDRNTQREETP